jgi:MarR family transcriptional regulator, organic hydroperoxide resistance regulator
MKPDLAVPDATRDAGEKPSLPRELSVGYQIRATHRLMQRALQSRIEQHGVTLGMWYFLRVLWTEEGLTQSELSRRVGTMEPTTLAAIRDMERAGIVTRSPDPTDRRKINIFLTEHGRSLEAKLLPFAIEVVESALNGLTAREVRMLLDLLTAVQENMQQ